MVKLVFAHQRPELKEDAEPCIFPYVPEYVSTSSSKTRLADVEEQQMCQAISGSMATLKQFIEKR